VRCVGVFGVQFLQDLGNLLNLPLILPHQRASTCLGERVELSFERLLSPVQQLPTGKGHRQSL